MRENNVGIAFRIIGTMYVMYKIATLFIEALENSGSLETWYVIVIAMFMGMVSIFFVWLGAESTDEKERK